MINVNIQSLNNLIIKLEDKFSIAHNMQVYICIKNKLVYAALNLKNTFIFTKLKNINENISVAFTLNIEEFSKKEFINIAFVNNEILVDGEIKSVLLNFPSPFINYVEICTFSIKDHSNINFLDMISGYRGNCCGIIAKKDNFKIITLGSYISVKLTFPVNDFKNEYSAIVEKQDMIMALLLADNSNVKVYETKDKLLLFKINNNLIISCRKNKEVKTSIDNFENDFKIDGAEKKISIYTFIDKVEYVHKQKVFNNEELRDKFLQVSSDFNKVILINPDELESFDENNIYIDLITAYLLRGQRFKNEITEKHIYSKTKEKDNSRMLLINDNVEIVISIFDPRKKELS